jgi:hypothetical protein
VQSLEPVALADVLGSLAPPEGGWGLRVRLPVQGCPPLAPLGAALFEAPAERLTLVRLGLLQGDGRAVR